MNFKAKVMKYLNIKNSDLPDLLAPLCTLEYGKPSDFFQIDKAKEIILDSIKNKEKIMIYGDYDCDGIMATSIMYLCLEKLGNKPGYYIPSRSIDGYGITLDMAKKIYEKGYNLLITVDNGVNQKEALSFLYEKGVKIVITDHHQFNTLPPHHAILHPFLKKEPMEQCGAYVAYILSEALLNERDDLLLSYASLATISDMMPLKGYNRNIVRLGLRIINDNINHPFHLLYNKEIDEEIMEYQIAPRINAYGRMKEDATISSILPLFISADMKKKRAIVKEIEMLNTERKDILKNADEELKIIEDRGVILIHNNIKEGLIGLLAAKYLNLKHKPTMALILKDDIYKGSIRSISGSPLDEFFPLVQDLVLTSGGHALAGGISFTKDNLDKIIASFETFLKDHPYKEEEKIAIEINSNEVNRDNYDFINDLSPYGKDFPRPLFSLTLCDQNYIFIKDHVKAFLNYEASLIGFNLKDKLSDDKNTFLGYIKEDNYHIGNLSFVANEIKND